MRRIALIATAAALCAGLTGFAALQHTTHPASPTAAPAPAADAAHTGASIGTVVTALQDKVRRQPSDALSWARLGSSYVEQARLTVDPTLYPKAETALRRSLTLQPDTNTAAQTGMAGLANARHQFTQARTWAQQAVNGAPYTWAAYGALTDALTQLGDDTGAQAAVQRMLDLHPSTASFTRASYTLELQGRTDEAAQALQHALEDASNPADQAFCQHYLGELAFNTGAAAAALEHYRRALALDPTYTAALAGVARAEAALGRTAQAVTDYQTAIARVPQPQYVLELGELLEALGRTAEAKAQYAVLEAEQKLFAANGVVDDLNLGQYQADHGDPQRAVTLLTAEWGRRHNVQVADALSWALHRAGHDEEALPLAREANRLGWRDATLRYHRGVIEQDLGDTQAARIDLTAALTANPSFSPLRAPDARARLARLQGKR